MSIRQEPAGLDRNCSIRQELVQVDWSSLAASIKYVCMWDVFKSVMLRVQTMHVPVRGRGKAGGREEGWSILKKDIKRAIARSGRKD